MEKIILSKRLTTPFLQALPPQVEHFDAYIYAVVPRKKEKEVDSKYGKNVRIDPCVLNWEQKTITAIIPLDINDGITSTNDLDDNWLEIVEASFLMLIFGCLP
jgi:hypothetical protein